MKELTKDHAASLELVQIYEQRKWAGDLGEKRQPHPRPGFFKRLWIRWFA